MTIIDITLISQAILNILGFIVIRRLIRDNTFILKALRLLDKRQELMKNKQIIMNTQNTLPFDYVEICGLRIATTNLGTDADHPMGQYYNFDEALEACPAGWRPMTHKDSVRLCEQTWKRIETRDEIKGLALRDDNGVEVFLPLAGWKDKNGDLHVGTEGNYWSSSFCSSATDYRSYYLYFNYNGAVYPSYNANRSSYGLSLRCVQEIQ